MISRDGVPRREPLDRDVEPADHSTPRPRGARTALGRGGGPASSSLVIEGARTIVFMKSRKGVELMAKFAELELENAATRSWRERIAPYRAGYTPAQRREIERRLTAGELLGVVTTDALELGIDIGALDAAICRHLPGHRRLA